MGKIMRNGKKYSGASSSMAENIVYDNTESGLEANDVQGAIDELNTSVNELNSNLTNENSETFNFGVLNGVRGFFTNPSRADDSFVPFNGEPEIITGRGKYSYTLEKDCLIMVITNNTNQPVKLDDTNIQLISQGYMDSQLYNYGLWVTDKFNATKGQTLTVGKDKNAGYTIIYV